MPRAQDLLSGAVWIFCLIHLQQATVVLDFETKTVLDDEHSGLHTKELGDLNDFFSVEWTDEDLAILKNVMDEHVVQFKAMLQEENNLFYHDINSRHRRSQPNVRVPTVVGVNRIPSIGLNASAIQLENQHSVSCFAWNGERFCILGGTIFMFKDGKAVSFVSGLPVGSNDYVKVHVYDGAIFLAIYNKITSSLRLYLLQSPGWITLRSIQLITGEELEDCVFFEHEGNFYMALAIQLGPVQFSNDIGMQCVIYEWVGTTMDVVHSFPAPGLRKILAVQSSDSVHLLLVHSNSSLHMREFHHHDSTQETELLEMIDLRVGVLQAEVFEVESRWCVFLAGSDISYVYCLQGKRLLLWQTLTHNHTTSSFSWTFIQQEGIRDNYKATIVIFSSLNSQSSFEYYVSDQFGVFNWVFATPSLGLDGVPVASLALLDGSQAAHLYVATQDKNKYFLEGFAIELSESHPQEVQMDPLLQCLSSVDMLISNLDSSEIDKAKQLMDNMVHYKQDFITDANLIVTQMSYSQPSELGTIKVLYNFTGDVKSPKEIESSIKKLQLATNDLSQELPDLLRVGNPSFKGRLRFNGTVTADEVRLPSAFVTTLNGRVWNEFLNDTLRYFTNQTINNDVTIGEVKAEEVSVGSTIGDSLPSRWLLKTGGELTGQTAFASLEVRGSLDVGKHLINGVAMEDAIINNGSQIVVQGLKTFAAIEVKNNLTAETVNQRDFGAWAETLVLQRRKIQQRFTGSVHLKGPVQVVNHFHSDFINGINVSSLPETIVDKNTHQIITGAVSFKEALLVADAEVESINDMLIEDVLSTSGRQTIKATIDVDILEVKGDLECPDINGQNVNDFVYIDEEGLQTVQGRLQFNNNLIIKQLVMDNGTLNDLDVVDLFDPPSLRIDSQIQANGDLTAHAAHVKTMNGLELSDLRRHYWTKSTNQTIQVNVRMPFEVVVKENITTRTFMNRSLERDFFFTKANETFNVDTAFTSDVTISSDLIIDDLKDINGVTLQALDEDVVKKEGDFQILGSKSIEQLIIQGDLIVEETFNNLNIPQDIALLNRSQTLAGVYFKSDVSVEGNVLTSRGDITVNTIAGILLDDFIETAVMIDQDTVIDGSVRFQRHLDVSNLVVENLMNGKDINNIIQNGIRRYNKDVVNLPKLTIVGNVTFKDSVDTVDINNYNVEEYLGNVVDMTNSKTITGVKKISQPVRAQNATFELFNGLPLNLSNILTISDDQKITGQYELDHLVSDNIELRAINGRNLSDYVKTVDTKEVQIISGDIDIEHMNVEGSLKIEDQVLNGCNLTDYMDVSKFTHFDSLSIQNGTLILEQPAHNNPDLATISLKALRKDRSQVVSGNVTFLSDVHADHLNVSQNKVGSVDLEELLHDTMLKSVEQNVSGTIKYLNGISVEHVEPVARVNISKWNGKNLQEIVDQVVLKTGNQTVKATKHFIADLNIQGNLEVKRIIDDVPVATLVKTVDPRLPSGTKFTSLLVKNQLNVTSGMIDGVNITSWMQQRVPLRDNCTIKSNIIFNGSVTADNVNAKTINGLNMTNLVLKTAAPGQAMTGKKVLKGKLNVEGDITVDVLNGQNPEEMTASIVLKDQNAEFQNMVTFLGGLTIMKNANVTTYNKDNMNEIISESKVPDMRSIAIARTPAYPLLLSLQRSQEKLASFEFFEQIQEISFSFVHGSNASIHIQHCPIPTRMQSSTTDTAAGIIVATHSTDGNTCKQNRTCPCHRSVTLPSNINGQVNTLRMPTRLENYMEDNLIYGDRVRLLSSQDHLFIFTIESLPGCMADKVTIAAVNPLTFKVLTETALEMNDTVVDVTLAQRNDDGQVILAISQKSSGLWIYTFDGNAFHSRVLLETERVAAIHMISHGNSLFLAIASYGLEAMSSIWNVTSFGTIDLIRDVVTVGATDVLFTIANGDVYVTFAQDPSGIDSYTDNSQLKVPAQVLMYVPSFANFEVVQQLDIDRISSLANMVINGDSFMAVATLSSKVRIYRLIKGQGFKAEQTFKYSGLRSIAGYSIRNQTFLAAASETRLSVFVARLRGPQKPALLL